MKLVFLINHSRDIPLVSLFQKLCPFNIDVIVTHFRHSTEYNYGRHKEIRIFFKENELEDIQKIFNNVTICRSYEQFIYHTSKYDVAVSRGREFIIIKPFVKKAIALSLNRTYTDRLIDVLPEWGDRLKIFLSGDAWYDKNQCGNFLNINEHHYNVMKNNSQSFGVFDPTPKYYDLLSDIGKNEIRKEFNIPTNKKVAFLSYRKEIIDELSLWDSDNEFLEKTKKMLVKFKKMGYFIISRRRLDVDSVAVYKNTNSVNLWGFDEVKDMIDMEMDGNEGFPSVLWKIMFCSDIHLLSDNSGIANIEAANTRTPVYMPYEDGKYSNLNPPLVDMINRGLVFNKIDDKTIDNFHKNINLYIDNWYNYNEKFWDELK